MSTGVEVNRAGGRWRLLEPRSIGLTGIALGIVAFLLLIGVMGNHWATGASATVGSLEAGDGGNVERVARAIFTTYLWPFELTSALLVVAVVGGVALARRSRESDGLEEGAA